MIEKLSETQQTLRDYAMRKLDYSKEGVDECTLASYKHRLDYFSGLAMQAILSKPSYNEGHAEAIARMAKIIATAMINELEKPNASIVAERVSETEVLIDGKLYRLSTDSEAADFIWGKNTSV